MPEQLAFYFDASACSNCKTCQITCQEKNHLPAEVAWRHVTQYGGGGWISNGNLYRPVGIFTYSISTACMHCGNPACTKRCPRKAITKRADGVVLIDAKDCIGCRTCEKVCPYGAPQYDDAAHKMTKCDFCQDLLAHGLNPACVDACPMRALGFGQLGELRSRYGNCSAVEPLPLAHLTSPSIVITPHRHAQASGKGTGRILDLRKAV